MKIPSSFSAALRHLAIIAGIFPVVVLAGGSPVEEVPVETSSSVIGWHRGLDPMDFVEEADARDILVGAFTYQYLFGADFDTLPGEVSADEFSAFFPVLLLSNDRMRVMTYLNYRATSFDTSVPNLLPEGTLHTIRLPVTFLYDYSEKWLIGGMVMPGLSGDMNSTSDAFSFSVVAGVGYKQNPDLRWFGGVFYSQGFDDDILTPGLGVMWNPTPKWSVNVLPPFANASWRFHENYALTLFGRYESATWNVEADSAGPDRDVAMSSLRVGLRLERRLSDHFWAQISGGVSFAREMEIETLSSATLQEDDVDAAPFVQAGVNIRF